jgi:hypothetical protein
VGAADPFAELDALRTERNSAVAEAKLWLRRMLTMQRERDQAKLNLYECDKCLGEWQAAYDDLLRAFRRLEVAYGHEKWAAETGDFLIAHLQPLAMAQLQRLIDEAPE